MLIDRTHKSWLVFTTVATVLVLISYAFYAHASARFGGPGPSGSSWPGLVYGILGFLLMSFCGLLGLRKRVRIWRLGRAQTWLRAHIWLGLLATPLIFCHAGMKMGNALTFVLMVMFTIVILVGILGVILQIILPKIMFDRLQAETTYEQIPQVLNAIRREADEIVTRVCGTLDDAGPQPEQPPHPEAERPRKKNTVIMTLKKEGAVQGKTYKDKGAGAAEAARGSEPLKSFYLGEVRPYLATKSKYRSRLGSSDGAAVFFEFMRTMLPVPLHEALHDLQTICEERRQLALQERMHFVLHGWLLIHVPLSYALLLLALMHAIVATLRF